MKCSLLRTLHTCHFILVYSEGECSWHSKVTAAAKVGNIQAIGRLRQSVRPTEIPSVEANGDVRRVVHPLHVTIQKYDICCSAIGSNDCLECVDLKTRV